MNEKEKARNSHIDFSRSDKNKYLQQDSIRDLYKREFGSALEKYNAKQKRNDRKIDDYYKHIEKGKKTSTQQEMIIQIGDKDDFIDNEPNRKVANEVLEEWFHDFKDRNPQLKIYNATIHNDEASPHMHLNFVPVAEGYKRGLERQVAFDKAIKQQDDSLNKERPFQDWREKEVTFLEEKINERGIERVLVGTNEYKDVNEFKEKQDELKALEEQIDHAKSDLNNVQAVKDDLSIITSENEEKRSIGSKIGLKGRESVVIPKENYEKLYSLASKSVDHAESAEKHETENQQLKKELSESKRTLQTASKHFDNVMSAYKDLQKENKILHKAIDVLKDRFSEHKQQFSQIVGYAKMKAIAALGIKEYPKKTFNEKDQHEQEGKKEFVQEMKNKQKEKKRDRDQGMER